MFQHRTPTYYCIGHVPTSCRFIELWPCSTIVPRHIILLAMFQHRTPTYYCFGYVPTSCRSIAPWPCSTIVLHAILFRWPCSNIVPLHSTVAMFHHRTASILFRWPCSNIVPLRSTVVMFQHHTPNILFNWPCSNISPRYSVVNASSTNQMSHDFNELYMALTRLRYWHSCLL